MAMTCSALRKKLKEMNVPLSRFMRDHLGTHECVFYIWEKRGSIPQRWVLPIEKALAKKEKTLTKLHKKEATNPEITLDALFERLNSLEAKIDKLLAQKAMRPVKKLVFKPEEEIHYSQLIQ